MRGQLRCKRAVLRARRFDAEQGSHEVAALERLQERWATQNCWHTARHTFASHLVMRGAPIKAVQELLGHSTIEMTMRYAHLSPDARREAVRLLDVKEAITLRWTTSKGTVLCIPLGTRRMRRAA
jgi:integrase